MTTSMLEPFVDQKAAIVTTFKRDGTPVGTTVNVAVEGDHAYFRTAASTGKAKRLRNNPAVEMAPSTFFGKPIGPAVRAQTRLLSGSEADHAADVIVHKHPFLQGWFVKYGHRLFRMQTVHYELDPVPG